MNKKIENHEDKYIHIEKDFAFSLLFAVIFLIVGLGNIYLLCTYFNTEELNFATTFLSAEIVTCIFGLITIPFIDFGGK